MWNNVAEFTMSMKQKYLDEIEVELNSYFTESLLDDFDIFHPFRMSYYIGKSKTVSVKEPGSTVSQLFSGQDLSRNSLLI